VTVRMVSLLCETGVRCFWRTYLLMQDVRCTVGPSSFSFKRTAPAEEGIKGFDRFIRCDAP